MAGAAEDDTPALHVRWFEGTRIRVEAKELRPDLRADLEDVLRRIAAEGHIPVRGNIDLRFRLAID